MSLRLGSPLTEANLNNTHVKVNDFKSKYLVWNGDGTTAFFHTPVVQTNKEIILLVSLPELSSSEMPILFSCVKNRKYPKL